MATKTTTNDPTHYFGSDVVRCPECGHGIDPHGVDPGGICGVGDENGQPCQCLMQPNGIACMLLTTSTSDEIELHSTFTTVEQLDALPPGTVVRTANPNAVPGVALWTMMGNIESGGPWWLCNEDDSFRSQDVLYGYGSAEVIWMPGKDKH